MKHKHYEIKDQNNNFLASAKTPKEVDAYLDKYQGKKILKVYKVIIKTNLIKTT